MWDLISKAINASGAIELAVLYLLGIFSIVSWALILLKIRSLGAAKRNNAKLLDLFNISDSIGEFTPPSSKGPAPLAAIFSAAVDTIEKASHAGTRHVNLSPDKLHEKLLQRMQHTSKDEMSALRWGSGFLASVGSASPFIGLLGTVWGIMATFQMMGVSAKLDYIAPKISSALIATAAGLAVAIPAVMAYNWVLSRIDLLQEESDTFIERMDLLSRTEYPGAVGEAHATSANGEPAASPEDAIGTVGISAAKRGK